MTQLFNVTNTGTLSLSTTLTRALSTVGASVNTGNTPTFITTETKFSPFFFAELLPIRGIFLHIHSVAPNAVGTLTIALSTDTQQTHTFNYPISALAQGKYNGIEYTSSQYWQGFNTGDIDLGNIAMFCVALSCNTTKELSILASNTNFNRFIIPVSAWNDLGKFDPLSKITIGGYLHPDALTVSAANILCDISADVGSINVTNGGTLNINSSGKLNVSNDLLIVTGGTLSAVDSASILLQNDAKFVGLDKSRIVLNGTPKLPYCNLAADLNAGDTQLATIEDISTWSTNDALLFLPNTSISVTDTSELATILSTNSNQITITAPVAHPHISIQSAPLFGILGNFLGSPVCNLTRTLTVDGLGNACFRAEDSCNLTIKNTGLLNLGYDIEKKKGAINLFNNQTLIENCVLSGDSTNNTGVYIDAISASNFNLNNNVFASFPANAICVEGVFTNNIESYITNNICTNTSTGMIISDAMKVSINGNLCTNNTSAGINIGNTNVARVSTFRDNIFYKNKAEGATIRNLIGDIKNNTFVFNQTKGVHFIFNNKFIPISATNINSAFNKDVGVHAQSTNVVGSYVSLSGIKSISNNKGVVLDNIYGDVYTLSASNNTLTGVDVLNCFNGVLNLNNFNVAANGSNMVYRYPSNFNCNFQPTYLTNSIIGNSTDSTCITLLETNCEKFVVETTNFESTGPNITLTPSQTRLIEGSYIFSGCGFGPIKFDNIPTKYQSNILNESGFVVMHEKANESNHQKYTAVGSILADTSTFHDNTYQISEKITPASLTLPIKSNSRIIAIDNFTNGVPPVLSPTSLYVSVWVKKDALWGSNSNPQLIVAANPLLNIQYDTVIDTHSTSTTDWVQLSSISPVATASTTRGAVEIFIQCYGNSGGSINIDSWQANFVRV